MNPLLAACMLGVASLGLAQTAIGQAGRLTAEPQIVTIAPQDLQPIPPRSLALAERRERLNKTLAGDGDPHDVILELTRIGDATSVPPLIETLAKLGRVPREGTYGAIDTHFHCLDALRVITNQDAGRNAEDWRAWYEANKDKTQEQWVRDGFAQHQFPVADPTNDAFVSALIRASDPKYRPEQIRANALRLLRTVSADRVVRLAHPSAESSDVGSRRATVAALEVVSGPGRIVILRSLAADNDIDVAENALRTLNAALRSVTSPIAADTVWEVRLAKAGVHVLHVLDERTVILGIGYGIVDETRVVALDLPTQRVIWTYATRDGVRTNAVRIRDSLYFVSDDRVIHCVSIDGKFQWMKPLTAEPVRGSSGPSIFAFGDRLFVPDGKAIYIATLSGLIEAYQGDFVSRDLVQGRHHVFGAVINGPLLVFDDPAKPPRQVSTGVNAVHLSAGGASICVVSGGPVYVLQCLDEDTLRERWRAELPKETGSYHELLQDDENVYIQAQGRALAFNIRSGKRLWATNEFRSFGFFKVFGRAALTRNDNFELEWRDPSSGEVFAQWGKRVRGDRSLFSNATLVGNNVLMEIGGDQGDGLRLLKVPDVIQRRLKP
jgi:hypothetical protein